MSNSNLALKKIAIVLPDLRGGGAERLHVNLANDWIERGYLVDVVLMRATGEWTAHLSPKARLIELRTNRIRRVIFPLRNYFLEARPDIILAAMWPLSSATVVAWLLSGKAGRLYVSEHSVISISCVRELKVSLAYVKLVIRATYRFSTGIIAVSHGVKEDLRQLGRLAASRIRVIYNPAATGVSPIKASKADQESIWGAGFKFHILTVGALKEAKDHATLIRAFALLPRDLEARLIILGEGPLRADLNRLIAELSLQDSISLPGFVAAPYQWFLGADLFVLSSEWEGFGNVLVEALECGIPVVSTACPCGPAEILDGGRFGDLVPTRDPAALATAMRASLAAEHDREKLTERAKAFSISAISDQYVAYFDSLAR